MRINVVIILSICLIISCDEDDILLAPLEETEILKDHKKINDDDYNCFCSPIEIPAEPVKGFVPLLLDLKERNKFNSTGNVPTFKVFVSFIVDKQGILSSFEIIRGVRKDYDQEAIRLISTSEYKWRAGQVGDKTVRQRIVLPIHFFIE